MKTILVFPGHGAEYVGMFDYFKDEMNSPFFKKAEAAFFENSGGKIF